MKKLLFIVCVCTSLLARSQSMKAPDDLKVGHKTKSGQVFINDTLLIDWLKAHGLGSEQIVGIENEVLLSDGEGGIKVYPNYRLLEERLNLKTSSFDNLLFGSGGNSITTGEFNSFLGITSGNANTIGSDNTFISYGAGTSNIGGDKNVFIGKNAGEKGTDADNSIYIGYMAGNDGDGIYNIGLGMYALENTGDGIANVALGSLAGRNIGSSSNNVFVGNNSGQNSIAGNQTFLGYQSGLSNTTGEYNTFVGYQSGYSNLTGTSNTFIGYYSGYSNGIGNNNTFLGYRSGLSNNTGTRNVFIGKDSGLDNNSGNDGTFVGYLAGTNNTTGASNTFTGAQSGFNMTTGNYNTFTGYYAGRNSNGNGNVCTGYWAGGQMSSGLYNVMLGYNAGYSTTTTSNNTYIGYNAGYGATGANNVFIGSQAGSDESGSNKLYIDNSATPLPLIYGDFSTNKLIFNGDATFTGNIDGAGCGIDVNCVKAGSLEIESKPNPPLILVSGQITNINNVPFFYNGKDQGRIITEVNNNTNINGNLNLIDNSDTLKISNANDKWIIKSNSDTIQFGDSSLKILPEGDVYVDGSLILDGVFCNSTYELVAYMPEDSIFVTNATTEFTHMGGDNPNQFVITDVNGFKRDLGDTIYFEKNVNDPRILFDFVISADANTSTSGVNRDVTYGIFIKNVGDSEYSEVISLRSKALTTSANQYNPQPILSSHKLSLQNLCKIVVKVKVDSPTEVSTKGFRFYIREI